MDLSMENPMENDLREIARIVAKRVFLLWLLEAEREGRTFTLFANVYGKAGDRAIASRLNDAVYTVLLGGDFESYSFSLDAVSRLAFEYLALEHVELEPTGGPALYTGEPDQRVSLTEFARSQMEKGGSALEEKSSQAACFGTPTAWQS